jgi:hypothetical protein
MFRTLCLDGGERESIENAMKSCAHELKNAVQVSRYVPEQAPFHVPFLALVDFLGKSWLLVLENVRLVGQLFFQAIVC